MAWNSGSSGPEHSSVNGLANAETSCSDVFDPIWKQKTVSIPKGIVFRISCITLKRAQGKCTNGSCFVLGPPFNTHWKSLRRWKCYSRKLRTCVIDTSLRMQTIRQGETSCFGLPPAESPTHGGFLGRDQASAQPIVCTRGRFSSDIPPAYAFDSIRILV